MVRCIVIFEFTLMINLKATNALSGTMPWSLMKLASLMGALACLAQGLPASALQLDSNGGHACAVIADGQVRCWGINRLGQLGDGTTVDRLVPVVVAGPFGEATDVSVGGEHTCALLRSGDLRCWGSNARGQLGMPGAGGSASPVNVVAAGSGIVSVATGAYHTCVVKNSGAVLCWGANSYGQLGNGSTVDSAVPVSPIGLDHGVVQLATKFDHTCAVMADRTVRCWGYNYSGQVGDGTLVDRLAPATVPNVAGVDTVTAAGWRSCVLTLQAKVYCWGELEHHVFDGGIYVVSPVPVLIGGFTGRPIALSDDGDSSCIVDELGGAQCWGDNYVGQLGDGTRNYRRLPGYVVGLQQGVRQVAMGGGSACAMLVSGAVQCWGTNYLGQLGTGDRGDRNTPTLALLDYVLAPKNVVEYYNATLDHYFMTLLNVEVADLDAGDFSGWARTGLSFKAWPLAADGTSPVCRFYLPPARGDSHFYSASPGECDDVHSRYPDFFFESPEVMYIALPDAVTGACAPSTIPVFRLWNARVDTNHRYTSDPTIKAAMIAKGYIPEGYGPDGVIMCAPS